MISVPGPRRFRSALLRDRTAFCYYVRKSYLRRKAAVQIANVRELLIEKIAYVRNVDQQSLEAEIKAGGGNLQIDSKVGQAVVAYVEVALDAEGLVRVKDQTKQTLTTLNALEAMIEHRRAETKGDKDG